LENTQENLNTVHSGIVAIRHMCQDQEALVKALDILRKEKTGTDLIFQHHKAKLRELQDVEALLEQLLPQSKNITENNKLTVT